MHQHRLRLSLSSAVLYAVSCFIASAVVVAGFAIVARRPAITALEQAAYPFGISLYFAVPVALLAFGVSIVVLDPLRKRGTVVFIQVVLASITGAVVATVVASVVSLLQGNPESLIWVLIVVPWSGAFFGGGVLLDLLRKRLPSLKLVFPAVAVVFASLGVATLAIATQS